MIFGTQLCKWILIILVNLLRCVPCTSLSPGDVILTSLKSCRSPCKWHCHHATERDAKSLSLQRCGHPIRQIWIRWTTASGVCFKRGSTVRRSMMWRTWKNVCWGSGGCWTTPSLRRQLRNGVVVWMHVFVWMVDILNINFETVTFCCFFLFIYTGFRKCDRYKHVQSANIVWNVNTIHTTLALLCLRLSHGMVAT